MKLFKKTQKEEIIQDRNFTQKLDLFSNKITREELLEEYTKLNELYKTDSSEEIRLRMVEISNKLSPPSLNKEKKPFKLFGRKEKYEEKYCHTCKHNIAFHHKRGRSTGCRKCGCLRTIEEIMNPTDNGHNDSIIKIDITEDQV